LNGMALFSNLTTNTARTVRNRYDFTVLGSLPNARKALAFLANGRFTCSVDDAVSNHPGARNIFYRRICLTPTAYRLNSNHKVYVCIPTMNSANKISACLRELLNDLDMRGSAIQVDRELFVCVNGSSDGTEVAALRELLSPHYKCRVNLLIVKDKTGKAAAMNVLQAEVAMAAERDKLGNPDLEPYIYFMDDDVRIGAERVEYSGIKGIVGQINRGYATAVSGNLYVDYLGIDCLHPIETFWRHLNGARKRFVVEIPQLYGAGWGCRLADYPAAGVPRSLVGEDCYLSLFFDYAGSVRSLPDVRLSVPLPETAADSCGRWLRDSVAWEQIKRYVRHNNLFPDEAIARFHERRKQAFAEITATIGALPLLHPIRLANWLNWQIRLGLEGLQKRGMVPREFSVDGLEFFRIGQSARPADVSSPYQTYCQLKAEVPAIITVLGQEKCLNEEQIDSLSDHHLTDYEKLKILEKALEDPATREKAKQAAAQNILVEQFISLIEYLEQIKQMLVDPEQVRHLFKLAGIDLVGTLTIEAIGSGKVGFSYVVRDESHAYYYKYSDVLGKDFPPIFEERAEVHQHVLANCLAAEYVGQDRVMNVLYPSLEEARDALRRPEFGSQKILHRMMIEQDVSGSYRLYDQAIINSPARFSLDPIAHRQLVGYAQVLARLHGGSLALKRKYARGEASGLVAHLQLLGDRQIVGLDPQAHKKWLATLNYMFNNVRRFINNSAGQEKLYLEQLAASRAGLASRWQRLIDASADALIEYGALGHLDYSPKNFFVGIGAEADKVKVFDFKQIGFVDPALEAATALARRLRAEWRRETVGDRDLYPETQAIIDLFVRAYLKEFSDYGGELIAGKIEKRLKEFCAFLILDMIPNESKNFKSQSTAAKALIKLAETLLG